MNSLIRSLAAVAILLAITACGDDDTATSTTRAQEPTTTTTSTVIDTTTTTAPPTAEPDVQAEIDWILTILNGEELTAEDYEARFTEVFRNQLAYDDFVQLLDQQLRPGAPFTVVERTGDGASGEATIEASDGTLLRVPAELDDQGRIAGLFFQPADVPTLDDPPETVEDAFERLDRMGTFRGMTAEVVGGQCEPITSVSAGEPAPLGSVFKLYVLAAIGEAIGAGELAWDDEIVVRDELKSVPTGTMQDLEAGDTVTVLEAAELMISISDNTATDHLIDLIGRETVEAVLADYGHSTPGLNIPFLDTREFTALKVGPAEGLRTQWLSGGESEKRAILDQISDITPADLPIQEWTEPIDPDLLEWFASPQDLCTLAIRLAELADSVPEVGEILEINPGIPAEEGTWDNLWFKGGSEPGMVAGWWVTESGDQTFVTTGSLVDSNVIDQDEALLLLASARDLLAP